MGDCCDDPGERWPPGPGCTDKGSGGSWRRRTGRSGCWIRDEEVEGKDVSKMLALLLAQIEGSHAAP